MRFFVAVLVAGLFAAGAVQAQDAKQGKGRGGAQAREEMLKQYDANKDGKLDETERAKMVEDRIAKIKAGEVAPFLLQRFDEDKDGKLSDAEKEKLIASLKSGGFGGGAGGAGGRGGADFQKRLLDRFDANKDGKLDDAEKAKARESRPQGGGKKRPSSN